MRSSAVLESQCPYHHLHFCPFDRDLGLCICDSCPVTFIEVFLSVGMTVVNAWIDICFLFFVVTIWLYWHASQDCEVAFFWHCYGFMFVPFCFYVIVDFFTDVPVQICWQLCCGYVDIQPWRTWDILLQYGQWFSGIDHISCSLGLCHL